MPTPRVNMSKLRHALQLLHEATLSTRQIGQALNISKTTVSEIASYARAAGVDWPSAQGLTDEELQRRLYRPAVARSSSQLEPDYNWIHLELKRPGVTLQLLWEEYQQQHQGVAYKYTSFCVKYAAWAKTLKRSMRQTHVAGEKVFLDYAGQTMPIVDAATGGDHQGTDLRGGAGRLQLHLRVRHAHPDGTGLGRLHHRGAGLLRGCSALAGA